MPTAKPSRNLAIRKARGKCLHDVVLTNGAGPRQAFCVPDPARKLLQLVSAVQKRIARDASLAVDGGAKSAR